MSRTESFGDRRRGLWVAVLGPDGSGKSTLLDRLERDLAPRFRGTSRYHLRPHTGRSGPGRPTTDPHGRLPRGRVASVAKLALWWADYWIGYLARIRPAVRGGGLVLFDRYFDDLLVDPRRYRYGGPPALVRWMARSIPRPDAMLILDVPVEVLRQRKREVATEESARQRSAYRRLADERPTARRVDGGRPFEEVAADAASIVAGAAAEEAHAPGRG